MLNYTWHCKHTTGENLCTCYGKDANVPMEWRRLSNAEEVQISLLLLISDCVWADNAAGLFRGRTCKRSCARLQCLAKLQADKKAMHEEPHARSSMRAFYRNMDVLILGKHLEMPSWSSMSDVKGDTQRTTEPVHWAAKTVEHQEKNCKPTDFL